MLKKFASLMIISWFRENMKLTICFRKRLQFFEFIVDMLKKGPKL